MGAMAVLSLNLSSERSAKANTAKFMTTTVVMLLTLAAAMLALGGVALLFVGVAVGWLLVGLAAIPAMFVEWYHGELKSLPAEVHGQSVDAWLEASLLAGLKSNSTPKELATLVGASQAGQFMAIRFGLTANLLLNIASEDAKQTDDIWSDARDIQQQTKSPLMHGGVVAAALIRQFPNYEGLLAQMHLEYQDVVAGIKWYDHIQDLVGQQNKVRRTGGIARDWSFGYTPLLKRFGVNLS